MDQSIEELMKLTCYEIYVKYLLHFVLIVFVVKTA